MQLFSRWPEAQAHRLRWLLLIGWLLLILSLLIPAISLPLDMVPPCPAASGDCWRHGQPGNRFFWGVVVPSGVLMIVLFSHELWRRICPLAFVSQLSRALGRQRTRIAKNGKAEVVKVQADSWLGRNHLQLQWSLLIAGLCLRLLVVNSSPLGLALLLLCTIAAALIVGWAYGGKAWCQYVCPMAPVQTILTGQRAALGSTAHMGTGSKITQSMCRSIGSSGREQSACVACASACIDIDSERQFWTNLNGKRGLEWAWYSYPGLVLVFFEYLAEMHEQVLVLPFFSNSQLSYLRNGFWAYDAELPQRSLQGFSAEIPVPNLIMVPLVLSLAGAISVLLFRWLEVRLQRRLERQGRRDAKARARSRTRLLASFSGVNIFFWFVDPSQGAFGSDGGQLIRSVVLIATAIVLFRSWGRDQDTYRRESISESLRRQLQDLPELDQALDGRSLQELSPQEVVTLAKALPAVGQQKARLIYRGVIADLLRSGRLERASSLMQLQDLRQALGLEDQDHHAALRVLADEHPQLLKLDGLQLQQQDLRQAAVAEQLEELMDAADLQVLVPSSLRPAMQQRLEKLRQSCGLAADDWQQMLSRFGPQGDRLRQHIESLGQQWRQQGQLLATLNLAANQHSLLRPLVLAMQLRVKTLQGLLLSQSKHLEQEYEHQQLDPAGTLQEALDQLWLDPDPDTAGWVLLVERQLYPEQVSRRLQQSRQCSASSPFLEMQISGEPHPDAAEFPYLAASPLFADVLPAGVVWIATQGDIYQWGPGEMVMAEGTISDGFGIVLSGACEVALDQGNIVVLGPGETVGEMGVITGNRRNNNVVAGAQGLKAFQVPSDAFEELLHRSPYFSRGLLRQLAERLSVTKN
ncbi:cyclic nucleotide-binding domain-containing protein [Cyanobium sp. HWJ4-Hawea]|uniref:cyclic nucleotide-binding domain-containing protein n=1 Tax=Cyanobium sp. HWJ4-Hawea TaxID=2823713 RepID=UPI0020CBF78A|nr:cyclic nucleotide-binding domain-containing protein [Cyanobium sp. HWJ4-Hawea]MCP9808177.1 cyclic nucleotide-binding domain-containing protein [Cyanobium sp. HWJ4-Hawea]